MPHIAVIRRVGEGGPGRNWPGGGGGRYSGDADAVRIPKPKVLSAI